jgi:Zn-dependent metalloprotease
MNQRSCRCYIVPPHILDRVLDRGNAKQKEWARNMVASSARLRGRRDAFTLLGAALVVPAGTKRRTIYNAHSTENLPGDLVRSENQKPVADDAVNQAFDGSGSTYDFYNDVYGRNSIDGRGMRLDSSVHYSQDFDNAFWDGRQMVYGDGGQFFHNFTACLDVIGHEMTHGVTGFESGLVYQGQPGALNESISDVFGSLVKQWVNKQTADKADWLIGEGIFINDEPGKALRSMKAPGTAYDDPDLGKDPQPAHMNNLYTGNQDHGGVHINSGIPNHAFYLTAIALGGSAWEKAGKIWYAALPHIPSDSDFQTAANIYYTTAGSLFGADSDEQKAVADAWKQVGIEVTRQLQAAVVLPFVAAQPARAALAATGTDARRPKGKKTRGGR